MAVDGVVHEGSSYIDESMITGEPRPVEKSTGAALTAGTVNGMGHVIYEARRVGQDTTLSQIIQLVEQAQGAKLPIKALVDRLTLMVRADGFGLGLGHSDGLADLGAGTGAALCAGGGGLRSDHRVPLRDGVGNTDVNHGGHRPCG